MAPDPRQIFGDVRPAPRFAVAVSGGSDSLALLFLLNDFLDDDTRLLAVTVDHGLRPESAAEALSVAALCRAHGIEHRTMAWRGQKPATGLIAAAREARYDLLAEAARDFGAQAIFVGHTLDDQAETVAMRMRRGEGAGLSGMARATLFDGDIWLLRPLLEVRRQALRRYLESRAIAWSDDPSNENEKFERVRIRNTLDETDIASLSQRARDAALKRKRLAGDAARMIERFAACPSAGLLRLDPQLFAEDNAAALLAFRAVLATAGGTFHLPDAPRAQELFTRLARRQEPTEKIRATLSRTIVDARTNGVWLLRETRDVPTVTLGREPLLWDGRWRIEGVPGTVVGPKGTVQGPETSASPDAPESLIFAAASLQPASKDAPGALHARQVIASYYRFLSEFDLPLAQALLRLLGEEPLPALPWKHHIDAEP